MIVKDDRLLFWFNTAAIFSANHKLPRAWFQVCFHYSAGLQYNQFNLFLNLYILIWFQTPGLGHVGKTNVRIIVFSRWSC